MFDDELAVRPQHFARRRIDADCAVTAEMTVQPSGFNHRCRRGVAVVMVDLLDGLRPKQRQTVQRLPGRQIDPHGSQRRSAAGRGRHPDLIATHDRRGMPQPRNLGPPDDVVLFTPPGRQCCGFGNSLAGRSTELGPDGRTVIRTCRRHQPGDAEQDNSERQSSSRNRSTNGNHARWDVSAACRGRPEPE